MTKTTMHLKDVDHAVQDSMSALRKAIAENIAHDDLFERASVRQAAENLCEAIRRQVDQDNRMQLEDEPLKAIFRPDIQLLPSGKTIKLSA